MLFSSNVQKSGSHAGVKDYFSTPNYMSDPRFKQFLETRNASINEGTGYMFATTDKHFYFPGDLLKGSVYFELFHSSVSVRLMIEICGITILPNQYHDNVFEIENDSINRNLDDNENP